MGRRSLPRIDKNIDLRDHLIHLEEVPENWLLLHPARAGAPLELEVGSGKGLFLVGAAQRCPERDFFGIEIAHKYARYAASRAARHGLHNVKLIHGDAMVLVTKFVPDASVDRLHVYFPDPWWKQRHRKRRIMNDLFLRQVERVLKVDGELHFWTDVEEYFHESLEQIAASTKLAGPFPVAEAPVQHDLDYRTHFERRMRKHELPIYRSLFRKQHTVA